MPVQFERAFFLLLLLHEGTCTFALDLAGYPFRVDGVFRYTSEFTNSHSTINSSHLYPACFYCWCGYQNWRSGQPYTSVVCSIVHHHYRNCCFLLHLSLTDPTVEYVDDWLNSSFDWYWIRTKSSKES